MLSRTTGRGHSFKRKRAKPLTKGSLTVESFQMLSRPTGRGQTNAFDWATVPPSDPSAFVGVDGEVDDFQLRAFWMRTITLTDHGRLVVNLMLPALAAGSLPHEMMEHTPTTRTVWHRLVR